MHITSPWRGPLKNRGRSTIVTVFLLMLSVLMIWAPNSAMAATSSKADLSPTRTRTVSTSGRPVAVPRIAAAGTTAAYCWVWNPGWKVTNLLGKTAYSWGINVEWCANSAKTKVVSLPYNYCLDLGGYYTFDSCKKQKGSLGYSYIGMYDIWHYHWFNGITTDNRSPSVRFNLHSNGGVEGTVYYDN